MRTILTILFLAVFIIISIPLYLILKLIGLFNRRVSVRASQAVIKWTFARALHIAGGRMTVLGLENIPTDRPCLFTGNHRSYFDIVMAYAVLPVPVGFIAKKEIRKVPGLNWWMGNMNCLFIDRSDMRQSLKTILKAIDIIKAGYSVFIMPEGTRNHNPEMLPFKEGSFKIADKTNCPIIPVATSNADAIYELHRPWCRKAKVVIHFGTPIETAELDKEARKSLGASVQAKVAKMLAEDSKLI